MRNEEINNKQEARYIDQTARPAIELLLDPKNPEKIWGEIIARDKSFISQTEERRTIIKTLETVVSLIPRPDISLETAVAENYITEEQVSNLYNSLCALLENPDYRRILLYLPFEFLPSLNWQPKSEALGLAISRFREVYMTAWNSLLSTQDVRANFVDGDVLEDESRDGDHPRVVKSAHLIPKLVEMGYLSPKDIIDLRTSSQNEILRNSIDDALLVLVDLGYIDNDAMSHLGVSQKTPKNNSKTITEKRAAWLQGEKIRKSVIIAGEKITQMIIDGALSEEDASRLLATETKSENLQATIIGIRDAIESLAISDIDRAKRIYAQYSSSIFKLLEDTSIETREAILATLRRLSVLGIVSRKELTSSGITSSRLDGPLSDNLASMADELKSIRLGAIQVETDPEISKYIYPVALLYGSRLKGYGDINSDIDLAVFIKPGAPFEEKQKIQIALKKNFHHDKIDGKILEFWLAESPEGLFVRDFENADSSIGASYSTHLLFGGAWEGNTQVISELRQRLLVPYFYDTKKNIYGRDARGLYIEELERDILQYRLMHKGYARFFPPFGGITTNHSDRIDSTSMFWDSGYRQLATRLYISRVFLPRLNSE